MHTKVLLYTNKNIGRHSGITFWDSHRVFLYRRKTFQENVSGTNSYSSSQNIPRMGDYIDRSRIFSQMWYIFYHRNQQYHQLAWHFLLLIIPLFFHKVIKLFVRAFALYIAGCPVFIKLMGFPRAIRLAHNTSNSNFSGKIFQSDPPAVFLQLALPHIDYLPPLCSQ